MKELTIVANLQFTFVVKATDDEADFIVPTVEETMKKWMADMKEATGADDLQLLDNKVFVMDKES